MPLAAPDESAAKTAAFDAIAFASMAHKNHLDSSDPALFLKVREYALVPLHKGYSIPSTLLVTKKPIYQYVWPLRVFEKIEKLAYCLDVSLNWRIHPVFLVAQLQPSVLLSQNLFQRPHPDHSSSVFFEWDTEFSQSFEVERLLNRCIIKRGREIWTQYLIFWIGYEPEFDPWYSLKEVDNAADLVREYKATLPK